MPLESIWTHELQLGIKFSNAWGGGVYMEDDTFSSLLSSLHLIIFSSFHVTTVLSSSNYYQHLFLTYIPHYSYSLLHIHQLTFFICFITSIYFSFHQIYTFHIYTLFFHSTISYFTMVLH